MKSKSYLILIVIAMLFSCDKDDFHEDDCIEGVGVVVSETRDLGNFHSILNTVYADILITQGPVEDVIIEAQSNILEELKTSIQDGELIIETDRCIDIDQAIKIIVSIPEIMKLSLLGVGDFVAVNEFDVDNLEIFIAGSGNVYLQGKADDVDITLTGVGDINAYDLEVDDCTIVITGVGNAQVLVYDNLDVTISGVGTVFYRGTPSLNFTISGSGSVINDN